MPSLYKKSNSIHSRMLKKHFEDDYSISIPTLSHHRSVNRDSLQTMSYVNAVVKQGGFEGINLYTACMESGGRDSGVYGGDFLK